MTARLRELLVQGHWMQSVPVTGGAQCSPDAGNGGVRPIWEFCNSLAASKGGWFSMIGKPFSEDDLARVMHRR